LPVPVFLNRLDAPLCVFSLGIKIPWMFEQERLPNYSMGEKTQGLA
jgi:hypothetical protein